MAAWRAPCTQLASPAARPILNPMDGLINLLKPSGISSARALDAVRRITGQRKSGHAGTLDPAADGVLLICLGKATKLVEQLMDQPKLYRADARLDVTSESFDAARPLVPVEIKRVPAFEDVSAAARGLEGEIQQIPPAVSAVKVGGRRAYKLERAGQAPALSPRPVRVYWMQILSYEWPVVRFATACGRGTYVRALIRDLGAALGCGGCLTSLRRLAVGPFRSIDAWSLDQMRHARAGDEFLVPLERVRSLLAVRPIPIPPPAWSSEDGGQRDPASSP